MNEPDAHPPLPRRQVLRAAVVGGIAIYTASLGSRAYAALLDEMLLTAPAWNGRT
ncbi:MAG: hypothetical protein JO339_42090, partial [Alphaproteobacteria bacterium]|nr:hypothetical protein [Alphaproteobacteria bacterium]